jgi:LacI family transcriptional regulator
MSKGSLPRAIICGYDSIALGAMRAFFERGIKVPDDIAVIGIDDPPSSAYTTPSLSSISHKNEETCKAVASALMAKIKGEEYPDTINIICEFNERESSKI